MVLVRDEAGDHHAEDSSEHVDDHWASGILYNVFVYQHCLVGVVPEQLANGDEGQLVEAHFILLR